jgi:uncharacterized protein (DUF433 family)
MAMKQEHALASSSIGVGSYTAPEAARLLHMPAPNVNRWMRGYSYRRSGKQHDVAPLWVPQHPEIKEHLEIGFRDLIELRFVWAFVDAGVGLLAVRNCIEYARQVVDDERPFSTRRFQTDGRTIFLESILRTGETQLVDLKSGQYVLKQIIERTFKDLDLEDEIVARWRPFNGKKSIVIDPARAFGQPIAADYGVPTVSLAEAVEIEDSIDYVAKIFEVPAAVVRDAVNFENGLKSAA